ncbi:hypothetical protein B0H13DRAFT_1853559 [Mycena leptocephala]|nr:hypothetical protein B0H13DRAFT_1853559 [Mycena leptocephala]
MTGVGLCVSVTLLRQSTRQSASTENVTASVKRSVIYLRQLGLRPISYPSNIPSMAAVHLNLAPMVATFPELGTVEIQEQLLRPSALTEAHRTIDLAEATHVNPGLVPRDVVDDAHTRKTVLETIRESSPKSFHIGTFHSKQMGPWGSHLDERAGTRRCSTLTTTGGLASAITAKVGALMARNHNEIVDRTNDMNATLQGIPKMVAGSGSALATARTSPGTPAPVGTNTDVNSISPLLVDMTGGAVHQLNHGQILQLIEFYNDSFGIVVGDNIANRRLKVMNWLLR